LWCQLIIGQLFHRFSALGDDWQRLLQLKNFFLLRRAKGKT